MENFEGRKFTESEEIEEAEEGKVQGEVFGIIANSEEGQDEPEEIEEPEE